MEHQGDVKAKVENGEEQADRSGWSRRETSELHEWEID